MGKAKKAVKTVADDTKPEQPRLPDTATDGRKRASLLDTRGPWHMPLTAVDLVPDQPGFLIFVEGVLSPPECSRLIADASASELKASTEADRRPRKGEAYLDRESATFIDSALTQELWSRLHPLLPLVDRHTGVVVPHGFHGDGRGRGGKGREGVGGQLKYYRCLVFLCAMPCRAMPCLAMPCLAMPCLALPCHAVPCRAVLHHTTPHHTTSHHTTLNHTTKALVSPGFARPGTQGANASARTLTRAGKARPLGTRRSIQCCVSGRSSRIQLKRTQPSHPIPPPFIPSHILTYRANIAARKYAPICAPITYVCPAVGAGYLNSCGEAVGPGEQPLQGGETIFYRTQKHVLMEVKPTAGAVLLHAHGRRCLMHEGGEVTRGVKYLLRADIMYMPPISGEKVSVGAVTDGG